MPELPLPDGAEFLDLRYSCAAGARRYRLYVPSTADEGLQGLIVMLHGCTQSPEDFAAGTGMNALAEDTGYSLPIRRRPAAKIPCPAGTGSGRETRCAIPASLRSSPA